MGSYIEIIKIAIMYFPLISFVVSIPFILIEYHKYGSISFLKSLLLYSFILYLMCAYFLVILPLPSIDEVMRITGSRFQLIPFRFLFDLIKNTKGLSFIKILKNANFYIPLFNIILTVPFGAYLRYYFNLNFKKTILYSFLLSLFFELTQLSGLYFIYPRSYRLFDVDDLMLNTLGGIIGYFIIGTIIKHLPKKEEINENAKEKGKELSGFKRFVSFSLDLVFFIAITFLIIVLITFIMNVPIKNRYIMFGMLLIYYIIIPIILNGSTLAEKFINLKVVDYQNKDNILKLILRKLLFIISYIVIPFFLIKGILQLRNLNIESNLKTILIFSICILIFLIYFVAIIKYIFTNKPMFYESMSKTKMISTIK